MQRPRMPLSQRAKQFIPFAALRGYEEALRAKEREMRYIERPEFSDDAAEQINTELVNLSPGDVCTIRYYNCGMIEIVSGCISKLDTTFRRIYVDDTCIRIDDVLEVRRL